MPKKLRNIIPNHPPDFSQRSLDKEEDEYAEGEAADSPL
jgi:hypothetical protein